MIEEFKAVKQEIDVVVKLIVNRDAQVNKMLVLNLLSDVNQLVEELEYYVLTKTKSRIKYNV